MIQNGFYISLRKTTVVNVNEDVHSLPPDNGPIEEFAVADYPGCPEEWSKDGVFVKVEEGQPLWFDFRGNIECAVLPAVQRLNPVTNKPADLEAGLSKNPKQNYLKLPEQLWLDGYTSDGKVYQFMVTKAGEGLAVNEYLLPKHMRDSHALGFAFYAPKVERNPSWQNRRRSLEINIEPQSQWGGNMQTFGINAGCDELNELTSGINEEFTSGSAVPMSSPPPVSCNINHKTVSKSALRSIVSSTVDSIATVDILKDVVEQKVDKASMGQGGRIGQEVHSDNNTVDYYQDNPAAVLTVYLALPEQFDLIMKKGKSQDESRPDKYVHSGDLDGVQVPLISKKG